MFRKPRMFVVIIAAVMFIQGVCFADAESIKAKISNIIQRSNGGFSAVNISRFKQLSTQHRSNLNHDTTANTVSLSNQAGPITRNAAVEESVVNTQLSTPGRRSFIEQHLFNHEANRIQTTAGIVIYRPYELTSDLAEPQLKILGPKCKSGMKCGSKR